MSSEPMAETSFGTRQPRSGNPSMAPKSRDITGADHRCGGMAG